MAHILVPMSAFLLISLGHAWDNDFRGKLSFTCPADEVLRRISSTFSPISRDRKWQHYCKYAGRHKDCQWSGFVNNETQQFDFQCPANKVLVGHGSYYITLSSDRRFQYFCCGIIGLQLDDSLNAKLNKAGSDLNWYMYGMNVMQGFMSSYNGAKYDREFKGYYSSYSRIVCGNPGTPENSFKSSRFYFADSSHRKIESITTYSYDDVVKYNCLEGYAQVGGSSTRTCLGNKTWSGSDIRCEKINCGDPGPGDNTMKNGNVYTFGASLKYTCKAGYQPIGGSESIKCEATKMWSGKPLRCASAAMAVPDSDWKRAIYFFLGGFAGGIAVLLFVIILIYIIRRRRLTREESRPSRERVGMHEQIERPANKAKASRNDKDGNEAASMHKV